MKKVFLIVLSALVLASCGRPQRTVMPKSSETKQTNTEEKKQSGMDLKAIKAKDYSSIKGTWIDGRGNELVFDDRGWAAGVSDLVHQALSRRTRSLR